MNILVIIHEYPPHAGGGGIHAQGIALELARTHRVTIITPRLKTTGSLRHIKNLTIVRALTVGRVNAETQSRIQAYLSFISFIFSATATAAALCVTQQFDCIHSYFAIPSGLVAHGVSQLFRVPHLLTLIEADLFDPATGCTRPYTGILKKVIRKVIASADGCTAISRFIAEQAAMQYGITRSISIVHPGIAATGPYTPPDGQSVKKQIPLTIVSMGRLVERKDFSTLITAFSRMEDTTSRLVIIGTGPLFKALQHQVDILHLRSRIEFAGYLSEEKKHAQLYRADIFALTSVHEGFGIVFVEAMNCGLPLIGTNSGGQSDIIDEGKNGFLLGSGDTDALTKSLNLLAANRELRRAMGVSSLGKASLFYNQRSAALYEKCMECISRP